MEGPWRKETHFSHRQPTAPASTPGEGSLPTTDAQQAWGTAPHPQPCREPSHGSPHPEGRARKKRPPGSSWHSGRDPLLRLGLLLGSWSVCSLRGLESVPRRRHTRAGRGEGLTERATRVGVPAGAGGASLTCMSSTFPKNRPTGIGWLLSSSRKTLSSVCSGGLGPCSAGGARAVRLLGGSSPVRAPGVGRRGPSSVPAGPAAPTAVQGPRGGPAASGWARAPAPFPGGSTWSSANPRVLLAQGLSGGILGKATLLLLGTSFCNSDFRR